MEYGNNAIGRLSAFVISVFKNKRARTILAIIGFIAFAAFSAKCINKSINRTDSYVFFRAGKAILEGRELIVGSIPAIAGRIVSFYLSGYGIILISSLVMWIALNMLLLKERTRHTNQGAIAW